MHILKSKHTLEERIADETRKLIGTSPFRGLCLKLLAAKRPQNMKPDTNRAQAEAEELHHLLAGESKDKDCKTKFIEIFTERSWVYIAEFVKKFQTISKDWTLESAIRKEFGNSSDTAQALRTIADFSMQPFSALYLVNQSFAFSPCGQKKTYDFWAEKLRVAMKGYGTDDSKLIRIVVSRCEIDLMNVVH
ncbi:annexin, partial [Reticulomyxa filosa]